MRAIGVIDYGMGNLHSLGKALERVCSATRVEVSYDPEVLMKCDRIVLPGVGGVKACMNELRRLELNEMVREAARTKPLMGICLGMQVMLDHSEENGGVDALGIISGQVRRSPDPPPADPADGPRLKVPHMGWNRVRQSMPTHPMWKNVPDNSWFYFVHSYYVALALPSDRMGEAEYMQPFTAALAHENIVAFQFHPEKSQATGIQLLTNFVDWSP